MAFSAVKHSSHLSIAPSNRAVPRARVWLLVRRGGRQGWSGDWFSPSCGISEFGYRTDVSVCGPAIDVVRGPHRSVGSSSSRSAMKEIGFLIFNV